MAQHRESAIFYIFFSNYGSKNFNQPFNTVKLVLTYQQISKIDLQNFEEESQKAATA